MSKQPILENTERVSGREALQKNTAAALALAGAVRSTLGPLGLDKLLIDDEGRTLVTNDGVTVLESAKVEHPVAKMIIDASSTQDRVVRDGTTSTVLLCAEMLRNAWHLVSQGVHPSTIARGYALAQDHAVDALDDLIVEADIIKAVNTSISGKLNQGMQVHLSELALKAANVIFNDEKKADPTRIKVIQQIGGKMTDSKLISGLAIAKSCIHPQMVTNRGPGNILLIDGGIERKKPSFDAKIKISSTGMLDAFREVEVASVMKQIDSIKDLDVDLVICRDGVDDEARQALKDAGILAYRRVEKADLDLLALATGASLIYDVNRAVKADRGTFMATSEDISGGVNHWILEGEDGGATFIAKGSTPDIADEVERCFADAVGVACQLLEDSSLVPGAGATQVALARGLRRYAESIPGREQLAIEAWADALEVIPRTLAENAGMDPTDSLLELTASQSKDGINIGLDLIARKSTDVVSAGILDPVSVIRQSISGANEATISVLRIDDVLWAQQDPQVPDEVQERLDASNQFA